MLRHLSIQSKLVLLLLLVSLGSVAVIACIGYNSGSKAMKESVENQLIGLRESRADQLRSLIKFIRGQVLTSSENPTVAQAMRDFQVAFRKLETQPAKPNPEWDAKLKDWDGKLDNFYTEKFLPELQNRLNGPPIAGAFVPPSQAARIVQYQYIVSNPNPPDKRELYDPAPDDSEYSKVHKKYHPLFRSITETFGYDDLLLIDPDTFQVVYSVKKAPDLGTSPLDKDSPYAANNLARLLREVQLEKAIRKVHFSPFDSYPPRLAKPVSFIGCPISDGAGVSGILAVQLPIDEVNRVLTSGMNWERDGLGKTGEVFIVDEQFRMCSIARAYHVDPESYLASLKAAGFPDEADKVKRAETTVLTLNIQTPPVISARNGKSETAEVQDHRGVLVISAPALFEGEAEGYNWVIVAQMDKDEAYGPVRGFGRDVAIAAATLAVCVSLLALLLSARFVRPIHQLVEGARKVSEGQSDVTVDVRSRDEFRELADTFNEMTRNLKAKSELIDRQVRENEELLLNILPGPAAARLRHGEQQISETHADVSVLFAEVVGFNELTASLSADRSLGWLNDLVIAFDEAAERHGVEKVKTIGASYLAACGLNVQRIDHTHRMAEFAMDMLRIVRRFNQDHSTDLALNIGINAGPVVGGVVGRTRFIYDLWGDTVNGARSLSPRGDVDTIRVTQAVRDRLRDLHEFEGPEEVEVPGKGRLKIWIMATPAVQAPQEPARPRQEGNARK